MHFKDYFIKPQKNTFFWPFLSIMRWAYRPLCQKNLFNKKVIGDTLLQSEGIRFIGIKKILGCSLFLGYFMVNFAQALHASENDQAHIEPVMPLAVSIENTAYVASLQNLMNQLCELRNALNNEWLETVCGCISSVNIEDSLAEGVGIDQSVLNSHYYPMLKISYEIYLKKIFRQLISLLKDPALLFKGNPNADFLIRHADYLKQMMSYFMKGFEHEGFMQYNMENIKETIMTLLQLFHFSRASDASFNEHFQIDYPIDCLLMAFENELRLSGIAQFTDEAAEKLEDDINLQALSRAYLLYIRIQIYLESYKTYREHLSRKYEDLKEKVHLIESRVAAVNQERNRTRINIALELDYQSLFQAYADMQLKMNRIKNLIQHLKMQTNEYAHLLRGLLNQYKNSLLIFDGRFFVNALDDLGALRPWLELRKALALLTHQLLEALPQAYPNVVFVVDDRPTLNRTTHIPFRLEEGPLGPLTREADFQTHLRYHNPDHGSPLRRFVLERDSTGMQHEF